MKVLYVAHFGEQSNWSYSAIHRVLSLQNSDVDVVCKNIPLQNGKSNIPEFIENLTKNDKDELGEKKLKELKNFEIEIKYLD